MVSFVVVVDQDLSAFESVSYAAPAIDLAHALAACPICRFPSCAFPRMSQPWIPGCKCPIFATPQLRHVPAVMPQL